MRLLSTPVILILAACGSSPPVSEVVADYEAANPNEYEDCGTSTWEFDSCESGRQALVDCLVAAADACTPASGSLGGPTTEGDDIRFYWFVHENTNPDQTGCVITEFLDSTEDAFAEEQAIVQRQCTAIESTGSECPLPDATGCVVVETF